MSLAPRVVLIHRRTELDELLARHGTRQQAAFFLSTRGQRLDDAEARAAAQHTALAAVSAAIPVDWRRGQVERADLDRFLFEPEDVVVAVGQDGLVANVAKYLDDQAVIGIDPEPGRNPGVLVRHRPEATGDLLRDVVRGRAQLQRRSMVAANLDDGQSLVALNEVYIGHTGHQSARYRLRLPDGRDERQSSSGMLVGTGTGATGWLRSTWQERRSQLALPVPEAREVCWFVREAWPSPTTGTSLTEGRLPEGQSLTVLAEGDQLVAFGDGIERDALELSWGQRLTVTVADRSLNLAA